MMARARLVLLLSLSVVAACSSTVNGTGSSSSSSSSSSGSSTGNAVQACKDTADAVAKLAERCGLDYQKNYDGFVESVANGDCNNITQVRNESLLRSTCLPTFETMSCADFEAGNLDPSCKQQLLKPASAATIAPASVFAGVAP